jgi:FlgD Ig-like domain
MRCYKARQRLIECGGSVAKHEMELLEHLQQCRKCTEFAKAERTLMRDIEAVSVDEEVVSLSVMKKRVESQAYSQFENKSKETSIMSLFVNNFRKRPRLGISIGLATIVLALVTLVPFTIEDKIGYEVAIAGVDKDLAMDSVKVEELLVKLGLDEAVFNVSGCEATCNLKISELKSEDDAKIIVTAFNELDNCIIENISEVHAPGKITIINKAKDVLFFSSDDNSDGEFDFYSDEGDKIYEIVIGNLQELDEAHDGTFSIWFSECGDSDNMVFEMTGDNCFFSNNGDSNNVQLYFNDKIHSSVYSDSDGLTYAIVIDADGNEHRIDMSDDDAHEQLVALGCVDIENQILDCRSDSSLSLYIVGESTDDNITCGHNFGNRHTTVSVNEISDDSVVMIIDTDKGTVHEILLNNEDALEQLKALGVNIEYVMNDDNTISMIYYCSQDNDDAADNSTAATEEYLTDENILKESTTLPEGYELTQNYPNPFNPTTQISYTLPEDQHVSIKIFNLQGQRVRTLVDRVISAGEHSVEWDSTNDNGGKVSSGVYFYRFTAGNVVVKKKMTLLK